MSGLAPAWRALARVRRREATNVAAFGAPWLAILVWLAWRDASALAALAVGGVGVLVLCGVAWLRLRRHDRAWLVRALDAQLPALQDSSDLLFVAPAGLTPVARLQQSRAMAALQASRPELRAARPWTALAASAAGAAALAVLLTLWPVPEASPGRVLPRAARASVGPVLEADVEITPPTYTGRAARRGPALDLELEQDARVAWSLRLTPAPAAVRLRFVDGQAIALEPRDGGWHGARAFARSTLYRIEADGWPGPAGELHRIQVLPDRPPQLTVSAPDRTLTVLEGATRHWALAFEARDDYGLADARLELTLAQGSGEQVEVSERRVALRGEGNATQRSYAHRIDLGALGFAEGDDLIARLVVSDNRAPTPNVARSASFILRWPPEQGGEGSGVDGLVQKAMPAYFRSQRQIILDTEALLAQRATLSPGEFVARSDAIGADQRLLRLRYGQFLGEEAEDAENPETHDEEHAAPEGVASDAAALMAEAGHLHDIAEAATLLDPQTRALLRDALRAMWDAEGELRTGRPQAALPHEYRALEKVKLVQQSNRIYLARVGLELPPLDATRRLTGEAPAAATRRDPLAPPEASASPFQTAWDALQDGDDALPLDAMVAALQDAPDDAGTLPLLEAIEAWRARPGCDGCRARLEARLWPRLPSPATPPPLRVAPDASGRAYLDSLAPESSP